VETCGRAGQAEDCNIIRRMRIASWVTKATDAHLKYAIIIAFPPHKWLRERGLIVRSYVLCLVCV